MQHLPNSLLPGGSFPLGATWDGLGVDLAVYRRAANGVCLFAFEPSGRHEIARYSLPEYTGEVWHGYLPGATTGLLYGYRAHGPYAPEQGHRFNHHKLYSDLTQGWPAMCTGRTLSTAFVSIHCAAICSSTATVRRRCRRALVTDDWFNWGDGRQPAVPWSETAIYEAHVRGLTMLHHGVRPSEHEWHLAGLSHPAVIEHLRRLGITAIELMPVHASYQDRFVLQRGLRDFWGYNTLAFFARNRRICRTARQTKCASRCAGCAPPASR